MWYRFSKLKWVWDVTDGIEYSYAYVKADSEEEAINEIPTIRENNEIEGEILVIKILHKDN